MFIVKFEKFRMQKVSTRGQSNLAKAASNALPLHPRRWGIDTPVTQCSLGPKGLHAEQDLNPFIRFCTAKPRKAP